MTDHRPDPLRRLLDDQEVAALATLHRGEPAVSMVPFVLWQPQAGGMQDRACLLIHVSGLATHTADMATHPQVALLVTDEPREGVSAQARARVSLVAEVLVLPRDGQTYGAGRAAYLARFPSAEPIFELADFRLLALQPRSARLVGGFGQARSLVGEGLQAWLAGG
jgi:putative heme iron utilization protein